MRKNIKYIFLALCIILMLSSCDFFEMALTKLKTISIHNMSEEPVKVSSPYIKGKSEFTIPAYGRESAKVSDYVSNLTLFLDGPCFDSSQDFYLTSYQTSIDLKPDYKVIQVYNGTSYTLAFPQIGSKYLNVTKNHYSDLVHYMSPGQTAYAFIPTNSITGTRFECSIGSTSYESRSYITGSYYNISSYDLQKKYPYL